jgi:hypothetical protein
VVSIVLVVAYVRTVKTASEARAVQIVHSQLRGSRDIEHLGSAHTDADWELLVAAARQKIAAGQDKLDLRLPDSPPAGGGPLPITGSRMGVLVDALERAYEALGFDRAARKDEVFKQLVLARIIEPTSKLDSLRGRDRRAVLCHAQAASARLRKPACEGRAPTRTRRRQRTAGLRAAGRGSDRWSVTDEDREGVRRARGAGAGDVQLV